MPAPPAITNFTQTNSDVDTDGPELELNWQHAGTNLDRFEIMFREDGETEWTSWHLAPKGDFFVSGTSYQTHVEAMENSEWIVVAMASDNTISTNNPKLKRVAKMNGMWLKAYKDGKSMNGRFNRPDFRIHVAADQFQFVIPQETELLDLPFRDAKMVLMGATHFHEGSVAGQIVKKANVSANEFRRRLKTLVKRQENYRILLVTPHISFWSIKIPDAVSYQPYTMRQVLYDVDIPFVQINDKPNRSKR